MDLEGNKHKLSEISKKEKDGMFFLRCGIYPHAFCGCHREFAKSQCFFDHILAALCLGRTGRSLVERKYNVATLQQS